MIGHDTVDSDLGRLAVTSEAIDIQTHPSSQTLDVELRMNKKHPGRWHDPERFSAASKALSNVFGIEQNLYGIRIDGDIWGDHQRTGMCARHEYLVDVVGWDVICLMYAKPTACSDCVFSNRVDDRVVSSFKTKGKMGRNWSSRKTVIEVAASAHPFGKAGTPKLAVEVSKYFNHDFLTDILSEAIVGEGKSARVQRRGQRPDIR